MLRINFIFYSLMAAVMVLQSTVDCIPDEGIPALITRRSTGDTYRFYNPEDSFSACGEGTNLTYLVHERQCVDEQQLLNDCSFSITPNEEFSNFEIVLQIADRQGTTLLMSPVTVDSLNDPADAVVVYRGSNQPVNGSLCIISNLEVYRGRGQITEIESGGFSLNERGFIQTDNASLVYNIEEYLGELYRMNLSCSGGGLPESGCLFFKVIQSAGVTNVLEAKFNSTVSGTLVTESDNKTSVMISLIPWTTPSATLATLPISSQRENDSMTLTTITLTREPGSKSIIEVGSTLFYIVIGAGSAVLILLLIITIMLTAICFLATKKGESYTLAIDDKNGDRARDSPNLNWPLQVQGITEALVESASQSELMLFNLGPRHDSVAKIASEPLYAEIREHDDSSPSPPPLPPPLMTDELIEEGSTTAESNYQANVSIPSHLKWPSKRASRTAELAYLYEGHDAAFHELPFYPKQAGVTDAVDPLYDDPTSLSLVPARGRVKDGCQKATHPQRRNGGVETEVRLS